ncbi:MAG: nucleoside diphosphate kinase regulator [Deltaproteobacteria bacterium]|nr:nucleoside diphosphate kinase regulator [Deltaproteobacteria bacterium]
MKEDAERLWALLEQGVGRRDREVVDQLEGELVRARIVAPEALPPNVVRVGSAVRYESASDGAARDVVLVWPHEADLAAGRISVLSPIGAALIGMQPGQEIGWTLPGGRETRVRVVAVSPGPTGA